MTDPHAPPPAEPAPPRRWSRVVDVVEGGVIYTEDAERLTLAGVTLPSQTERRAVAETYLNEMLSDKIVFYQASAKDALGRLEAEVWVGDLHINGAIRARGYTE